MITREIFDEIINDIRKDKGFIDVEKSDFMCLMSQLYPSYRTEELMREIESLD